MTALASAIVEPAAYRPSDDEPFMSERQLAYFKGKLMDWKDDILRESKGTVVNLKAETENHPGLFGVRSRPGIAHPRPPAQTDLQDR